VIRLLRPSSPVPRPFRWGTVILGLSLSAFLASTANPLGAQEREGSTSAAFGAAALGLYSGGALGLTGSLIPCSQMVRGLLCTRLALAAGGLLGGASGAIIGANDSDRAWDHAGRAGIGLLVGGISGAVLKEVVRQYGWLDAGSWALLGAAVGGAPAEAGIGLAAGSVAGALLWKFIPAFDVADAVSLSLGGMALGGLGGWIYSAAQASKENNGPQFILPITLTF
jgi:hypothetical protein